MDDKGRKKVIAIILDAVFIAVIIFAVYLLAVNNFISINENVLYAVIIMLIPTGFYMTYMSFAREIDWSSLPGYEDDEADEEDNGAAGDAAVKEDSED